ncbi:hypothetical protein [Paenibacillus daejeonensis]|uniref:hypothetical protein n=1 Tax=Paenibacillus daejeonensis TaxID=135193 RepID=UPI000377F588|nr:hypothetical protein [Paenibacillus daejeonensis]
MSKTKTGLFILALSVMLVGAGCGNNANDPANTTPPADTNIETPANDPATNDPANDPLTEDPADNADDDAVIEPDGDVVDPDAPAEGETTTP